MKQLSILFSLLVLLGSCKKFLDERPDASLVVPASVADLQRLMDNNRILNTIAGGTGECSADNYYLADADWSTLTEGDRNKYIWGAELFYTQVLNEWSHNYTLIYYANTVLEQLPKMPASESTAAARNNVKGSAYIYRGKCLLNLVQGWSPAYERADNPYGVPLRLTTNFNEVSVRATVHQCYQQVIHDLEQAVIYLPVVPEHKIRPSKPAAYALLAKAYLSMGEFEKAGKYADSCLQLYNRLLDYNSLNAAAAFPIPIYNEEVIWHIAMDYPLNLDQGRARIDSLLYRSYEPDDLRKTVFFAARGADVYAFKGNYMGSSGPFMGLATDEMFLTRAECAARTGRVADAMDDLNKLLEKRWKSSQFVPRTASNASQALQLILAERRKELLYRDIRFADIKRLNVQGEQIAVRRKLNNQLMELLPGDKRFALPIPQQAIEVSGMPQNPR